MHPDAQSKLGPSCGKKLGREITFTASPFISLSEVWKQQSDSLRLAKCNTFAH